MPSLLSPHNLSLIPSTCACTSKQEVMDMLCSRSKDLDAGLPEGGPLEIWEEVKKYPTLVADRLNPL